MGTRANIIIKMPEYTKIMKHKLPNGEFASRTIPEEEIILYRHWDGYPEATGADLVWVMDALQRWPQTAFPNAAAIQRLLFTLSSNHNLYRQLHTTAAALESRYQSYQETSGIHGDIEYLYTLTYVPNTNGNPATTLEIKNRDYNVGWAVNDPDAFLKTCRTIDVKAEMSSEKAFIDFANTTAQEDFVYSRIAASATTEESVVEVTE